LPTCAAQSCRQSQVCEQHAAEQRATPVSCNACHHVCANKKQSLPRAQARSTLHLNVADPLTTWLSCMLTFAIGLKWAPRESSVPVLMCTPDAQ
jgi:hypothetical protein